MRARGILGVAAVTATVFALAGCGGSSGAGSGSSLGAGAAIAPADSVAFAAVDTDLSSSQWKAVDSLLAEVPGARRAAREAPAERRAEDRLSWANDIKPALGPELDVVVLPQGANGKPQLVGLTQPADASKFDALLRKLGTAKCDADRHDAGLRLDGVRREPGRARRGHGARRRTSRRTTTYQDAIAKLSNDAVVDAVRERGRGEAGGRRSHCRRRSIFRAAPRCSGSPPTSSRRAAG